MSYTLLFLKKAHRSSRSRLTDASGNRISVTLNQGQTAQKTSKYLLDEKTSYAQVLEERAPDVNDSGTSVLQARMVWGGGLAPVAMWRKMPDGTVKAFYFVTDGQESVRQLTDSAGLVTDSYYYDSWGTALAGGSGDTKNSFRYTGQMLDASGKYFLRARYYDPSTARFLSHDPIMGGKEDPISLHRYLYAANDPVNMMDPSGESAEGLTGTVAALTISTIFLAQSPANAPVMGGTTLPPMTDAEVAVFIIESAVLGKALQIIGGKIVVPVLQSAGQWIGSKFSRVGPSGNWWEVSNLGRFRPGTRIPEDFNLTVHDKTYYVHPNATKHLEEYIRLQTKVSKPQFSASGEFPTTPLAGAVEQAQAMGLKPGRNFLRIKVDSQKMWELGIDTNDNVIYHALYKSY